MARRCAPGRMPHLAHEAADAQHEGRHNALAVQVTHKGGRHPPQAAAEPCHGVHCVLAAQHVHVGGRCHTVDDEVACMRPQRC